MQSTCVLAAVDAVRMASLTPARIAGLDADRGSIEAGKRADFVVLDEGLRCGRFTSAARRSSVRSDRTRAVRRGHSFCASG